jgi:hypothetical protein
MRVAIKSAPWALYHVSSNPAAAKQILIPRRSHSRNHLKTNQQEISLDNRIALRLT